MRRSEARELLMQMLYSMEAQGDFGGELEMRFEDDFLGESDQTDYFRAVWSAAADNKDEIDRIIAGYCKGWQLPRIARTDLAVLRLCVAEMCFAKDEDIPVGASINEAVKLAKKFGTEDSGKFVNGVLGRIAKDLESGELKPAEAADDEAAKPDDIATSGQDAADVTADGDEA